MALIGLISAGSMNQGKAQDLPDGAYTFLEEEGESRFNLTVNWTPAHEGEGRLVFNYQDPQHYYYALLTPRQISFMKVAAGQVRPLGRSGRLRPEEPGPPVRVTLQRRPWRMQLLCNGRLTAVAFDEAFQGGKAGYSVLGGNTKLEDPALQPLDEIYLTDDFMRQSGETGGWETLTGTWEVSGPKSPKPDSALSANPFSYLAHGGEPALSVIGHWFWDNYECQVAVKPTGDGAVGLAARVQDGNNYLLFRWTSGREEKDGEKQWIRVQGGQREVLATAPGGYEAQQWYLLTLQVSGSRLQASIDGQPVLRAEDETFGQGLVGLYAEGSNTFFDDLEITDWESFADDFSDGCVGKWKAVGSGWQVERERLTVSPGQPLRDVQPWDDAALEDQALTGTQPAKGREGIAVVGEATWRDYVFGANVQPTQADAIGLCFHFQDPQNYYLFRWGAAETEQPYRHSRQLLKVINGQAALLTESPGGFQPGKEYRLKVEVQQGYVQAYVDGEKVLEALDYDLPAGRIGLYHEGANRVAFDEVVVWFLKEQDLTPKLTERYLQEETMAGWASPQGAWRRVTDRLFWHRGDFFGTYHVLQVDLPQLGQQAGHFHAVLNGDGANLDSGYRLTLQSAGPGQPVQVELRRAGQVQTAVQRDLPAAGSGDPRRTGGQLRVLRRGRYVAALLNDQPLLIHRDDTPLTGRKVAVQWDTWPVDLGQVTVGSAHLLDYTFSVAPTDWHAERGVWEITDRWACFPGWSWLGGTQDLAPTLWSKRVFEGDLTLEFYAAIRMDRRDAGGYSHPSDINATICGDGKNLCSGYNFIYAGWGNTRSALWRGAKEVQANERARFDNPTSGNTEGFHRHWFYVRIERQGQQVRTFVDDQPIAAYTDNDPLPGGRIALWTYNNGLIIARARVWYEDGGTVEPLPPPERFKPVRTRGAALPPVLWSPTHPLIENDFEMDVGEVSAEDEERTILTLDATERRDGQASLKAYNRQGGNNFAVRLTAAPFNPRQQSHLRFDYRFPEGLRLNLYAQVRGKKHPIVLTGAAEPFGDAAVLGQIAGAAADGRWHRAEFDLGNALKQVYPEAVDLTVEQLELACYEPGQPYAAAGLGGVPWGATFHLDNFSLGGSGGPFALVQWHPRGEGDTFRRYRFALDRRRDTDPAKQKAVEETSATFEDLKEGTWYFHLQAQTDGGEWLPTVHYPLVVSHDAEIVRTAGLGRGLYPAGLRGEYFEDPDPAPEGPFFTELKFARTDPQIQFLWTEGASPGEGIGTEYWSARWTGKLWAPETGDYVFSLDNLDDAGRLYVDGKRIIDAWLLQTWSSHSSQPIRLTKGEHDLKVEYHQGPGMGAILASWKGPNFEKEAIPQANSFDANDPLRRGFLGEGVQGEYFEDPDHNTWAGLNAPPPGPFFQKRAFVQTDPTINFAWGNGESPREGFGPGYWSVRWTGKLLVPKTETYTFYLDNLDDAGRLYLDGQLILDSWLVQAPASHASDPIRLEEGFHDLTVEYHQAMALAGSIQLAWESPSLPKEIIPACFSRPGR